jgi:TonB family protein
MNDINNKSSALFTPSGCLTGDTLSLFVSGKLEDMELTLAQQHIAECPLCSDAAEGLMLWLKKNESDNAPAADETETRHKKTTEISDKHPFVKVHSHNSSVAALNEFHVRTDIINERIKQRLHTHALIEASENKRLSYKPFVWLAAAATVVLFIGGFWVIWVQNKFDNQKLTQERANEMLLLESHANSDTLVVSMPENKSVIAIMDKKKMESVNQPEKSTDVLVSAGEVYNQDMLNSPTEVESAPEVQQQEEVTLMKEESKESSVGKAASAPKGGEIGGVRQKTKVAKNMEESEAVFTIVEEMPSFPGGEIARNKFLSENIVYPQLATESGIQGTVYVSFIVDSKGNITDLKILRGIGSGCDEEAIRVVKLMPLWKPGRQNGKFVSVLFNMPIYFTLK